MFFYATYVCMYVYMYLHMYVCMYICMHVCMYVCIDRYLELLTLLCHGKCSSWEIGVTLGLGVVAPVSQSTSAPTISIELLSNADSYVYICMHVCMYVYVCM